MRKAVIAVVIVFALGLVAAAVAVAGEAGAKYICTMCKVGGEQAGKCPLCGKDFKMAGKYMCPACDTTSDTPGKCACGREYVKVEMAGVKCPGCGYYHAKDTKGCPVCDKMAKDKKQG